MSTFEFKRVPGWLLAIQLATVVIIAACQTTQSLPPTTTPVSVSPTPVITPGGPPPVVVGTVTAGPVCPVERSPAPPNCAPRPVAGAVVIASDANGGELARTTSSADGTYRLTVGQTGTVVITALPVSGLTRAPAPATVTLDGPGAVVKVNLEYDTGIR
jgi:hypothetical protein